MRKVLIVPCGTEIAQEVVRSLAYVKDVELFGANSIHCYTDLEPSHTVIGIPMISDANFISAIADLINNYGITHVVPAHDSAAVELSRYSNLLDAKVVSSSYDTNEICRSKTRTYKALESVIRVPKLYCKNSPNLTFPLFAKPDKGQGSVGTFLVRNYSDIQNLTSDDVLCELLPGEEYTVDCVSDRSANLLYAGPRRRSLVRNGISVESELILDKEEFEGIARKISSTLRLRGAWFFQVKKDAHGELCLLEVATRIAGSMITNRINGVNFSELSLLVSDDIDIKVLPNNLSAKLYRSLAYQFESDLFFTSVYVDFDDCILVKGALNIKLVTFIYDCINKNKKITLITRHKGDLDDVLKKHRIQNLFDEVIHIKNEKPKSHFIDNSEAIFIDDSFSERLDVRKKCGIPTFSPDMVECLLGLKDKPTCSRKPG